MNLLFSFNELDDKQLIVCQFLKHVNCDMNYLALLVLIKRNNFTGNKFATCNLFDCLI